MVAKEVEHEIFYFTKQSPGKWGLFDEKLVVSDESLWIDPVDIAFLNDQFDQMAVRTGQGYAEYQGDTVRFGAEHLSGARWVRSVCYLVETGQDIETWRCLARISDEETGQTIYTDHDFIWTPLEGIIQPETGSPDVRLASDKGIQHYHQTVSGAIPEPVRLPTVS